MIKYWHEPIITSFFTFSAQRTAFHDPLLVGLMSYPPALNRRRPMAAAAPLAGYRRPAAAALFLQQRQRRSAATPLLRRKRNRNCFEWCLRKGILHPAQCYMVCWILYPSLPTLCYYTNSSAANKQKHFIWLDNSQRGWTYFVLCLFKYTFRSKNLWYKYIFRTNMSIRGRSILIALLVYHVNNNEQRKFHKWDLVRARCNVHRSFFYHVTLYVECKGFLF